MADDPDIKSMISDHMEKGFLENIIDMFRHDKGLYPLIGDLMKDERMRVRLGISALVETLATWHSQGAVSSSSHRRAGEANGHFHAFKEIRDAKWRYATISPDQGDVYESSMQWQRIPSASAGKSVAPP